MMKRVCEGCAMMMARAPFRVPLLLLLLAVRPPAAPAVSLAAFGCDTPNATGHPRFYPAVPIAFLRGSGGTGCVVGRSECDSAIAAICEAYKERNGHKPHVFQGSSPGAVRFGHLNVRVM